MSEIIDVKKHVEEMERIGESAANAYNSGWLETLQKADIDTVRAFNTRYEALNYQREFDIISEEEYYRLLEEARDAYFSSNTQEWYKYTKEIYDYRVSKVAEYYDLMIEESKRAEEELARIEEERRKEYNDMCTDLGENIARIGQTAAKSFEGIVSAQQGYKSKLLDYAGSPTGFDTHVTWVDNYWPTGDPLKMVDYTLVNYEEEIAKLKSFNDSITKLKERAGEIDADVFSMFFDELRGMSVEDAKILTDLLLEANDEDFARHFDLYEERNTLAENMSLSYYSEEYDNLAQTIGKELEEVFGQLPDEFFEIGEELGENFASGFIAQINGIMHDISVDVPQIDASQNTTNVNNTEFSPVYYFYGDRATTSRTRIASKNDALFGYFRGIY